MSRPDGGFEKSYLGAMSGEGGIASKIDDMLRWMAHMVLPSVGCAKACELMKRPQTLADRPLRAMGWEYSEATIEASKRFTKAAAAWAPIPRCSIYPLSA